MWVEKIIAEELLAHLLPRVLLARFRILGTV